MADFFEGFMRGYDFVDRIKENQDLRARRDVLRQRDDEAYEKRREAEDYAELAARWDALSRNPDGTQKKWEEYTDEGKRMVLDLGNHPRLAHLRNVPGRQVDIVGAYGKGNDLVFEAEQKDPKTGRVISRGAISENRFGDPEDPKKQDPVRVFKLDEMGRRLRETADEAAKQYERISLELRSKVPALQDAYLKGADLRDRRADRGVMADEVVRQGRLQADPQASATFNDGAGDFQRLASAVETAESGGDPNAVSPKGAVGPMQTMPSTLADPGYGVRPAANNDPKELRRVGVDYLAAMLKEYGGNVTHALAAYNWGPGNANSWIKRGANPSELPKETREYIARVNKYYGGSAPSLAQGASYEQQSMARIPGSGPLMASADATAGYPSAPAAGSRPALADAREQAIMRQGDITMVQAERDAAAAAAAPRALPVMPNSPANLDAVREYAGALLEFQRSGAVAGGNYAQRARDRLTTAAAAIPADIRARIDENPAAALRGASDIVGASGVPQVTQDPEAVSKLKALDAELAELRKVPDNPEQAERDRTILEDIVKRAQVARTPAIRVSDKVIEAAKREYLRNPTPEGLEALHRLAKTGQLFKRDLKIFGSSAGDITVVDPETGETVSSTPSEYTQQMREARLFEKQKYLRAQQPNTPEWHEQQAKIAKARREIADYDYFEKRLEAMAESSNERWWALTGEKGKLNPAEVKQDIYDTIANEQDTLARLGFPSNLKEWRQADIDQFFSMYKQSRSDDTVKPGTFSKQYVDSTGTLSKTPNRGDGPRSPIIEAGGIRFDLRKVAAEAALPVDKGGLGRRVSLAEAEQIVLRSVGAQ